MGPIGEVTLEFSGTTKTAAIDWSAIRQRTKRKETIQVSDLEIKPHTRAACAYDMSLYELR